MKENHFNFTEKALATLPIPAHGSKAVTYYDSGCPSGLCVIVTYGGTKTYYFFMKYNGRPTRIKIGRVGQIKLSAARQQADDLRHMAAHGQQPTNKRKIDLKDITLKAFFDQQYTPKHCEIFKKKNSIKSDERIFKNTLKPFHNRKLLSITHEEVGELHISIKNNTGLHTANRMLSLLHHMYNKAIEWGVIPRNSDNPAAGTRKFPEKSRDRFMNGAEIKRFFEALYNEPNDRFRNYVLLSLFLGQRRNNILSIRWSDVDLDNGLVYFSETKNGEPLQVPLSTHAHALLTQMQQTQSSEWLFPSATSASGHYEEPKKAWQQLLERANIQNLRMHDLRRTLGSYQAIAGSSLHIIGRSLGHKSMAATEVYARLSTDPVRESVQRGTDKILSFVKAEEEKQPVTTEFHTWNTMEFQIEFIPIKDKSSIPNLPWGGIYAIGNLDNKVPIVKYPNNIEYPFGLPGGHIEKGETIEQTLFREIKEELNMSVADWLPIGYERVSLKDKPGDYKYALYVYAPLSKDGEWTPDVGGDVIGYDLMDIQDIAPVLRKGQRMDYMITTVQNYFDY